MTPAEASSELRQYIAECSANPRLREDKAAALGFLRANMLLQGFASLELSAQTHTMRTPDGREIPVNEKLQEIMERDVFCLFEQFKKNPGGRWSTEEIIDGLPKSRE